MKSHTHTCQHCGEEWHCRADVIESGAGWPERYCAAQIGDGLACDKWNRVEDNVAAIAQHIDALRRIDRYGVGTLYQAFAGYQKQLPGGESWWIVLGFETPPTSWAAVEDRYGDLAGKHHPDRGGDPITMGKINAARDTARKELVG